MRLKIYKNIEQEQEICMGLKLLLLLLLYVVYAVGEVKWKSAPPIIFWKGNYTVT